MIIRIVKPIGNGDTLKNTEKDNATFIKKIISCYGNCKFNPKYRYYLSKCSGKTDMFGNPVPKEGDKS